MEVALNVLGEARLREIFLEISRNWIWKRRIFFEIENKVKRLMISIFLVIFVR